MIIETTFIKDLLLLTPQVYLDERGYFMESYNKLRIGKMIKDEFVQDNESLSKKNVLRGLHLQLPNGSHYWLRGREYQLQKNFETTSINVTFFLLSSFADQGPADQLLHKPLDRGASQRQRE